MKLMSALPILAPVVLLAWLYQEHPLWFGRSVLVDQQPPKDFAIFTQQDGLDEALDRFKDVIGQDFVPYRNHCLRVLTFAQYYYVTDDNNPNDKAPSSEELNLMGLAIAYHDIALWTDGELDYLDPSVAAMEKDLTARNLTLSASDLATAKEIILQHHKWTEWTTTSSTASANAALVNAVRKGDWADATIGMIRGNLPPSHLEAAYQAIPEAGFHNVLMEMGPRLSPESLVGQLKVLNILKW